MAGKLDALIADYLKYGEKFIVSSKREQAALALADYVVANYRKNPPAKDGKWIGLSNEQLNDIEINYGIRSDGDAWVVCHLVDEVRKQRQEQEALKAEIHDLNTWKRYP